MISDKQQFRTRGFEELKVYQLSEELADEIWNIVIDWPEFARDTIGKQMTRNKGHMTND